MLLLLLWLLLPVPFAVAADERLERLPDKYQKWLEQEVIYIISDRERDAFLDLRSVDEWEAFINAFWRRRDPDPLTPVNEFREEHYRRIEFANRELGRESPVPGWMTDRGKMYIILGEPHDRDTFRSVGFLYPAELWFYLGNKEKNLPPLYLLFFQDGHAGPYRLFNHAIEGPEDLMAAPQPIDPQNARMEAYQALQNVSPELAHATVNMRADRGAYTNIWEPSLAALDAQIVLADIFQSPFRRLDTSYVDAVGARGLVESEYLFNYVPSAAVANVIPGPGGAKFVHYSIEIDPQHMTLVTEGNDYYTRLELRGEVTTAEEGLTVYQFTKGLYLSMTASEFQQVNYRPYSYRDMFPLCPGDFQFRVVLKNQARSEYTIFETSLRVPEPSPAPFLGTPVLLYGSSEIQSAGAAGTYGTYQLGSLKLDPNPKRIYAIGDTLGAYIPIESASDEHQISLRIVPLEDPVRVLASKTTPMGRYQGAPLVETQSLADLVGGHYRLVAELLDPAGEILETQFADFDITPLSRVLRPWVTREGIDGDNAARVQLALAEQHLNLGQVEKAREASRRALEADPDLPAPRVLLGRFFLDEHNPVEAIRLLEPAYVRDKENVDVLLTLGFAHVQAGSYPRAAGLLEEALVLRRPDARQLSALALCHAQMGDTQKALEYIERSLEVDPEQEGAKAFRDKLKTAAVDPHP